jgi:hypothetical protein
LMREVLFACQFSGQQDVMPVMPAAAAAGV